MGSPTAPPVFPSRLRDPSGSRCRSEDRPIRCGGPPMDMAILCGIPARSILRMRNDGGRGTGPGTSAASAERRWPLRLCPMGFPYQWNTQGTSGSSRHVLLSVGPTQGLDHHMSVQFAGACLSSVKPRDGLRDQPRPLQPAQFSRSISQDGIRRSRYTSDGSLPPQRMGEIADQSRVVQSGVRPDCLLLLRIAQRLDAFLRPATCLDARDTKAHKQEATNH